MAAADGAGSRGRTLSCVMCPRGQPQPNKLASQMSSHETPPSSCRTAPVREASNKTASGRSGLSPDASFSPSSVPQALNFSPEKRDFSFSKAALDGAQPPEDSSPAEVKGQVYLVVSPGLVEVALEAMGQLRVVAHGVAPVGIRP